MSGTSSILIVGKQGTVTEELINKLNKEGWRVFTLVGNTRSVKPARVFEQYHFDYTSDSIAEVIGSCRPTVILFTGAYDLLYTWSEKTQMEDSRNFIAGLSNLLMCAKEHGTRHFIYLSSECVFEESYTSNIPEDTPHTPVAHKGMAVSQGEKLVSTFRQFTSMEVSIARVANLYFVPKSAEECTNAFTKMCLNALLTGNLIVNAKKIRSCIFVGDAVQAIYLLMSAPDRKHTIYNISSEQEVSEYDIAQSIKIASSQPITVVDQTLGTVDRRILSCDRFGEEFKFKVRTSYSEAIPEIVLYMQGHRKQFSISRLDHRRFRAFMDRMIKTLGKLFPFFECFVFFVIFTLLSSLASNVSYLQGLDFYLFFVLLFAVIRGRFHAIIAFVLSVVGYCYTQIHIKSVMELLINLETYIWIVQLFVVGLTAGHLRDKLTQLEQDKDEEIRFLKSRLDDISSINSSNTKIKNYFEEHVINSNESIGWFYDIISRLDTAESGEVVFRAAGFLSEIMGTKDVAIYSVSNNDYCRLVTSTSLRARSLGKSIFMHKYNEVFEPLRNKNVYINRDFDTGKPSLASSLTDPDGKMQIIILLWDMAYEKMTLYYANILKVVGALIYNAMIRAANYLDALAYKRYISSTKILQQYAFEEMCAIYQKAGKSRLTEYCVLEIKIGAYPIAEWSRRLGKLLRRSDIVGLLSDNRLGILLTNTNEHEASSVINRLYKENIVAKFVPEKTED